MISTPPDLLSGKSARYWARWKIVSIGVLVGLSGWLFFAAKMNPETLDPMLAYAISGGAIVVVAGPLMRIERKRKEHEEDAGYCTQGPIAAFIESVEHRNNRTKMLRYDHLWRLNPKTGETIRPPRESGAGV